MIGAERSLLYDTAIQTGLRSNELRSLTRGRLYLNADPPYITCKGQSTKNGKDARQYIQPCLAADLKAHITTKAPKAPVFNLPHETNLARMLRDDLAEARKQWLSEAKDDPQELAQRQQSDFLTDTNDEGEVFDFHCLRHTCGAWLSMTGAHPKTVQTVMRHSTIVLTMDTYGHLFPGQEADAVAQMRHFLIADQPEALRATGTDDAAAKAPNQRAAYAQQLGRETQQSGATSCDKGTTVVAQTESPKPLRVADLGDGVRVDAKGNESTPSRIRTCDLRIRSPRVTPENPEENAHSREGAAQGAAVGAANTPNDPDLRAIIERWADLPDAVKAGIVAMVRAAGGKPDAR